MTQRNSAGVVARAVLEHLLVVEYGPALASVDEALREAAASDDPEIAERARVLMRNHARLLAGATEPPDEDAMFPALPPTPAGGLGGPAPAAPVVAVEAEQPSELDRILGVLREQDPAACRKAIERLVEIGDEAVPALEALLRDEDPDVRVDVQRALRLIRGESP